MRGGQGGILPGCAAGAQADKKNRHFKMQMQIISKKGHLENLGLINTNFLVRQGPGQAKT